MQLRALTFPGKFSLNTSKAVVSLHAGSLGMGGELTTLALHKTIWCYERISQNHAGRTVRSKKGPSTRPEQVPPIV